MLSSLSCEILSKPLNFFINQFPICETWSLHFFFSVHLHFKLHLAFAVCLHSTQVALESPAQRDSPWRLQWRATASHMLAWTSEWMIEDFQWGCVKKWADYTSQVCSCAVLVLMVHKVRAHVTSQLTLGNRFLLRSICYTDSIAPPSPACHLLDPKFSFSVPGLYTSPDKLVKLGLVVLEWKTFWLRLSRPTYPLTVACNVLASIK